MKMCNNDIEAIELGFKNMVDFEESLVSSVKINIFDPNYNFKKEKIKIILIVSICLIILLLEAIISKIALDIISIPSNMVSIFIISIIFVLFNLFRLKNREDNVSLYNKSIINFKFNNFTVLVLSKIFKPLHLAFYIISTIGSIWNIYYLINMNYVKELKEISIILECVCLIYNIITIIFIYSFLKKYNRINYIGSSIKTLKKFNLTYEL